MNVPEGLIVNSYPGSYGQVLTNLFLNAINHAFADGRAGTIKFEAKARGTDDIEIIFADDGAGMTPDVQRQAFNPFFTTRRSEGGTGLGLHIVYNLVTQQLGGRMMLEFEAGTRDDVSHYYPAVCAQRRRGQHHTFKSRKRAMADQDDVLQLIEDDVRPHAPPSAQMEDRRHRRRCGRARGHAVCAQRLCAERADARNPLGLFRRRGRKADARQSRHRRGAARRHHGDRRGRACNWSNTSATN